MCNEMARLCACTGKYKVTSFRNSVGRATIKRGDSQEAKHALKDVGNVKRACEDHA